jgi:hypothetical protein
MKKQNKYPEGHFISHYTSMGIVMGVGLGIPLGLILGNFSFFSIGIPIGLKKQKNKGKSGH